MLNLFQQYAHSGDVQKWIKFANSLKKLRLAICIAYADINKARENEKVQSHRNSVLLPKMKIMLLGIIL